MPESLLIGEYDLRIDPHCRLTVPAEVRRQLNPAVDGTAFLCRVGRDPVIQLYPERRFERLSVAEPEGSDEFEDLAVVTRVEPDAKGRILLPRRLMRGVGLVQDVTLIGVRDHLEIWDRAAWEKHRERIIAGR